MKEIGIIGTGITALAKAWQLQQAGARVTVLEPSNTIGGAIQSYRDGPYLAEEGPNSIQVNSEAVDTFLKSIPGIESRIITASTEAQKRFILRDGTPHAVPMGPLSAITTPLWSLSGKLRMLREPFISKNPAAIEESAADFARRRLGNELYEYAINPLIGGIYAGDPEALSLKYAFPKLYAVEQDHGGLIRGGIAKMRAARQSPTHSFEKRIISFKDGLHELPKLLVDALGTSIRRNVSIDSIQRAGNQWQLRIGEAAVIYDQLIVTTPAHSLERLPFDTEVERSLKAIPEIDYPPVSVLTLAFKRVAVAHPLDGFGVLVPKCERRTILGALFPSTLFTQRAPDDEVLLTVFVGGERQPELAVDSTEALKATVLPELRKVLGVHGEPTFCHHRHWPRAIPQYKIGYGAILAQIAAVEAQFPGLELRGNYRDGISLSYCIEAAFA